MSLTVLGVVARSFRLLGTLAAGATPDADDGAVALVAFNAMKRAWMGTLIGPRLSPIALSGAAGLAESGGDYQVPAGARFTLTPPRIITIVKFPSAFVTDWHRLTGAQKCEGDGTCALRSVDLNGNTRRNG